MKTTVAEVIMAEITRHFESMTQSSKKYHQKRLAISATFNRFKEATMEVISKIRNIPIEEVETYSIIMQLFEFLTQNLFFITHFKRWEFHKKTNEFYNHTLYEVARVIHAIGYGYTIIKKEYHSRWDSWKDYQKAIKSVYEAAVQFGDTAPNAKAILDFALSFEPKKINQYIAKVLQKAGISLYAIKLMFADGMTRITNKILNQITIPSLPLKVYA